MTVGFAPCQGVLAWAYASTEVSTTPRSVYDRRWMSSSQYEGVTRRFMMILGGKRRHEPVGDQVIVPAPGRDTPAVANHADAGGYWLGPGGPYAKRLRGCSPVHGSRPRKTFARHPPGIGSRKPGHRSTRLRNRPRSLPQTYLSQQCTDECLTQSPDPEPFGRVHTLQCT